MRTEILFKGYSIKNNAGAPFLSEFLYVRMLSLISNRGAVTAGTTLRTKSSNKLRAVKGVGFSYLNKVFFPFFANYKKLGGSCVGVLGGEHSNTFFWGMLFGLSFLSANVRVRKFYKNWPGIYRTRVVNAIPIHVNAPIHFFLTSSIRTRAVSSVPLTLRSAGLQFMGVELFRGLTAKVELYFKNLWVAGQIFPVMFNTFTLGFSEKFFYPYYYVTNVVDGFSLFNLLFGVVRAEISYLNRRPVEYLAGHKELFSKQYRQFFTRFAGNDDALFRYVLLYIYWSKFSQLDYFNKFPKLSDFGGISNRTTFSRFSGLFATRIIPWGLEDTRGGVSKDFYQFTYYFVNFLQYFRGWRSLMQLFLKIKWGSLGARRTRIAQIRQIVLRLPQLPRFFSHRSLRYCSSWRGFGNSFLKLFNPLVATDFQLALTYYLYNNTVRPIFLFFFLQKKIWFHLVGGCTLFFFGILRHVIGFCFYFIQRNDFEFNLITIKGSIRFYLNFFLKNYDYLFNFLEKIRSFSISRIAYFQFFLKISEIFIILPLNRILRVFVPGIVLLSFTLTVFWFAKICWMYLIWCLIGYVCVIFMYKYIWSFDGLSRRERRFFYFLFLRTQFFGSEFYFFFKIWGAAVLVYLIRRAWYFIFTLVLAFFKILFVKEYFIRQYITVLVKMRGNHFVLKHPSSYFSFPKFYTLSLFYFSKPSFFLSIRDNLLSFFWVSKSISGVIWLLRALVKILFSEFGWWWSGLTDRVERSEFVRIFFINLVLTRISPYNYYNSVTWFNLLPRFDRFLSILLELLFTRGFVTYSQYLQFYTKYTVRSSNFLKVQVLVRDILESGWAATFFGERLSNPKFGLMLFADYFGKWRLRSVILWVGLLIFGFSCIISLLLGNVFVVLICRLSSIFRIFYLLGK